MPRVRRLLGARPRILGLLEKTIFVLLGPSGSGKTTYGLNRHVTSHGEVMFLSTGLELRKQKIMTPWQKPDMIAVKEFCHKLINETVEDFKFSTTHQILILDCVKDLEDAEYIDAQLKKHGLEVTRALLFDVSPDELHRRWMIRGEDRDIFRGSTNSYLRSWSLKSNDLVNYYKKSELLCTNLERSDWTFGFDFDELSERYPVFPSKDNVHFVLTNSEQIKNIFAELLSILKVNQLRFMLPASFVHCYRDVTWVTNSSRYHVTVKADGVRCLLLKIQDGTYLITRKNEIYPCFIADDDKLPDNTVLDGELLPSTSFSEIHPKISTLMKTSVFLVFDVLAFLGDVLWKWPFSVRQECLCKLPISKDIAAVMEKAYSTDNKHVANAQNLQANLSKENNHPNQNELIVNCVVKNHKPSTPDEVLKFIGISSQIPYPCDGLVFTPNTAYVFGPDPLLFKWQSPDSVHCDILHKDLDSGKQKCVDFVWHPMDPFRPTSQENKQNNSMKKIWDQLNETDVIECQWNQSEGAWDPLFLRQDKSAPNSDETIDHVEKICKQPYSVEHLIADLTKIGTFFDELEDTANTTTSSSEDYTHHPSVCYSYDELYAKITEVVELGYVQKTVDPSSNLEILNYTTFVGNPLVCLCRGLVVDPDSKTIVTKPFVRFFEDVSERDLGEEVEATVKYDGSLGIAFVWKGEVLVTTKRRMNSEQATWAKQWILDHCDLTLFEAGYTYLFEIVYQNNIVVVDHLFEGLVLLAITTESGDRELPYEELLYYAKAIGFFMVTSRISAPYSEVLWYCGGIDSTKQESATPIEHPQISGALPVNKRQEGWVVKFKDGTRQKILYSWRKEVSEHAHLVHPQIVWLLVKHDKIKEFLGNVPSHFRVEISSMIRALGRKFAETVANVEEHLTLAGLNSPVSRELGNDMYGAWRRSVMTPLVSDESEDSADDSGEESLKLLEETKRMCLNESDEKTFIDENERVQENDMTLPSSQTKDFVKLARKLKPYWETECRKAFDDIEGEESVNLSPVYNSRKVNYLRLLVLEYICPATSPVLDGYEPTVNFKQNWCKGWKTLPVNRPRFIQEVLQENHQVPPFLQLPVEVIILLLEFLDGRSLVQMTRVCMQLRQIVESSQTLRKKIGAAKEDALKKKTSLLSKVGICRSRYYNREYSSEDDYCSEDDYRSQDEYWGRYGSF